MLVVSQNGQEVHRSQLELQLNMPSADRPLICTQLLSSVVQVPAGGGGGGGGGGMLNSRLGPTPSFACASLLAQVWCLP